MQSEDVPSPALDAKIAEEMQRRGIPTTDRAGALKEIANRIVSNEHFVAFLLTLEPEKRKTAYDELKPYLFFNVQPFTVLMARKQKVLRKMKKRLGYVPREQRG